MSEKNNFLKEIWNEHRPIVIMFICHIIITAFNFVGTVVRYPYALIANIALFFIVIYIYSISLIRVFVGEIKPNATNLKDSMKDLTEIVRKQIQEIEFSADNKKIIDLINDSIKKAQSNVFITGVNMNFLNRADDDDHDHGEGRDILIDAIKRGVCVTIVVTKWSGNNSKNGRAVKILNDLKCELSNDDKDRFNFAERDIIITTAFTAIDCEEKRQNQSTVFAKNYLVSNKSVKNTPSFYLCPELGAPLYEKYLEQMRAIINGDANKKLFCESENDNAKITSEMPA